MWLLLIAIGAFGLCYIINRLFPLTAMAVIVTIVILAYISFGEHETASDTVTKTGAAIIVIAFAADIILALTKAFTQRTKQNENEKGGRALGVLILIGIAIGVGVAFGPKSNHPASEPNPTYATSPTTSESKQRSLVEDGPDVNPRTASRQNPLTSPEPAISAAITPPAQPHLVLNPLAPQKQSLVPRNTEKPSFDCSKARTASARLICADAELAKLDGQLGVAFQKRKAQISTPDQSKFIGGQLAWIKDRNERCGLVGKNDASVEVLAGSKPCMVRLIRERIAFLAQTEATAVPAGTPSRPVPAAQARAVTVAPPGADLEKLNQIKNLTDQLRACIQNAAPDARQARIDVGKLTSTDELDRAVLFFSKRCFDPYYAGNQRVGPPFGLGFEAAKGGFWMIVMQETFSPEALADAKREVHRMINRLPPP